MLVEPSFYELINHHIKPLVDINRIVPIVSDGVKKMFVDFVDRLPQGLLFAVFQYLDHRSLIRASQINQKWHSLAFNDDIWKFKCYGRGWGLAFTIPTKIDWITLYKSLELADYSNSLSKVQKMLHGASSGQEMFKKLNSILTVLPEYVQLEKTIGSKSRTVADLVNFEAANSLFVAVEEEVSQLIVEELKGAGYEDKALQALIDRKNLLRNRMYSVRGEFGKGAYNFVMALHSVILRTAHKGGMLPPPLEKFRKAVLQNSESAVPIIKLDCTMLNGMKHYKEFPVKARNKKADKEKQMLDWEEHSQLLKCSLNDSLPKEDESTSIYITLAKFVLIVYAFHRGVEMGKFVLFQQRFLKSLHFIDLEIKKMLAGKELEMKQNDTRELRECAFLTYYSKCDSRIRRKFFEDWAYLGGSSSKFIDDLDLEFFATDLMRQNYRLVDHYKNRPVLFYDPQGVAGRILNLFFKGNLASIEFVESTLIDTLDAPDEDNQVYIVNFFDFNIEVAGSFNTTRACRRKNYLCTARMNCKTRNVCRQLGLELINLELDSESLEGLFLDLLTQSVSPEFIRKRNSQRKLVRALKSTLEQSLESVSQRLMDHPKILENVEFMLEVITLRKTFLSHKNESSILQKLEVECSHLLQPYQRIASFLNAFYSMTLRLQKVDPLYLFPLSCVEKMVEMIIKSNQSDGNIVDLNSERFISQLVLDLQEKMGEMLKSEHRGVFKCTVHILKSIYFDKDPPALFDEFIAIIGELSLLGSQKTNVSEWIQSEMQHHNFDEATKGCFRQISRQEPGWQEAREKLLKAPPLKCTRFIISSILLSSDKLRQASENLNTRLSEKASGNENTEIVSGNETDRNMTLLITRLPKNTLNFISNLYLSNDGNCHVSVLSDIDKFDRAFIGKIVNAVRAGRPVILILDNFWLKNLGAIVQLATQRNRGFHLWIIAHSHHRESLPRWLPRLCNIQDWDISFGAYSDCKELLLKVITEVESRAQKALDSRVFILLKLHSRVCRELMNSSSPFNELDFKIALSLLLSTKELSTDILQGLVLGEVYYQKADNLQARLHILQIWNEEVEVYFSIFETVEIIALPRLDGAFLDAEELFLEKQGREEIHLWTELHAKSVSDLSKVFEILLHPSQPPSSVHPRDSREGCIDDSLLPKSGNTLRLIIESQDSSPFKLFLRQEAANVKLAIEKVKSSRIAGYGQLSYNQGTPSEESTPSISGNLKILQILENVVMQSFLRTPVVLDVRLFSTLAGLLDSIYGVPLDFDHIAAYQIIKVCAERDLLQSDGRNEFDPPALLGLSVRDAYVDGNVIKFISKGNTQSVKAFLLKRISAKQQVDEKTFSCPIIEKSGLTGTYVAGQEHRTVGEILMKTDVPRPILRKSDINFIGRSLESAQAVEEGHQLMKSINWPELMITRSTDKEPCNIRVLVYFTSDCDNEKECVKAVIAKVSRKLKRIHPRMVLNFMDLIQLQEGTWTNDQFSASLDLISEADVKLFVVGNRLGQSYNTVREFEHVFKLLSVEMDPAFFFRSDSSLHTIPPSIKQNYTSEDEESTRKLSQIRYESSLKWDCQEYSAMFSFVKNDRAKMRGLEEFSKDFERKLLDRILTRSKNYSENSEKRHAALFKRLIPANREVATQVLDGLKERTESVCKIITGCVGSGKRTMLRSISRLLSDKSDRITISYIPSVPASEFNLEVCLAQLCKDLSAELSLNTLQIPTGLLALETRFFELVDLAAERKENLTILTGPLERADNEASVLKWIKRVMSVTRRSNSIISLVLCSSSIALESELRSSLHESLETHPLQSMSPDDYLKLLRTDRYFFDQQSLVEEISLHSPCKNVLYANMVLTKVKTIMEAGSLLKLSKLPCSTEDLALSCLEDLSQTTQWSVIREMLSFLCVSREGLKEIEIMELLELTAVDWQHMKKTILSYIRFTEEGYIVIFHELFQEKFEQIYLSALKVKQYHKNLASYFKESSSTRAVDPRRIIDAGYHLLKSDSSCESLGEVIANITFIKSAFESSLFHELPKILTEALLISRKNGYLENEIKLKECISFWQTYASLLVQSPSLTLSLALNLPGAKTHSLTYPFILY